jgi:hypothetical protein
MRQGLTLSSKGHVLFISLLYLKTTDDEKVKEANNLKCDTPL